MARTRSRRAAASAAASAWLRAQPSYRMAPTIAPCIRTAHPLPRDRRTRVQDGALADAGHHGARDMPIPSRTGCAA